jgi:hypothetical protein
MQSFEFGQLFESAESGNDAELFLEALTGEAESRPLPSPPPRPPSHGQAWAGRLLDQVAQQALLPGGTVAGPFPGSIWTVVAAPGGNAAASVARTGDLVLRPGRGGRPARLHVVDASIGRHDLVGGDGRLRADALVLRSDAGIAARPSPVPLPWDPEDDAEAVPTFEVGAADGIDAPGTCHFIELPADVEDWVPNAANTGIVMSRFTCRTGAELEAVSPGAGATIAAPPRLWRLTSTDRLEVLLQLLVFHPATTAGGTTLPPGRHPLAIICHGNHQVQDTAGGPEVPSYKGYSGVLPGPPPAGPALRTGPYLQEALAARGIISASVNMNPANLLDLHVETRARLIVAALARMNALDRTRGGRYDRRIDFQRVALIGHSRGGDAVARATAILPANTRVRAVVQIAPTDSTGILQGARPTTPPFVVPAGAPTPTFVTRPGIIPATAGKQLIIWGSRDGDVSGFQDVRADVSVNPCRHYDRSAIERAFQFWHGATHNRFNRLWKDRDEDRACLSQICQNPAGLLSRSNQEARTVEMVRGWLQFALYDDTSVAGLFDGRTTTSVAPANTIAAMWKFGARLATIDQFDDVKPTQNTLGGANVTPPTGVFDEVTIANENGAGAGTTAYQLPHIDRALRFSPAPPPILRVPLPTPLAPPVWRTTIPPGVMRNFGRFDLLTLRVTKKYDAAALAGGTATLPTVRVRLIGPTPTVTHQADARGRLSSLPVLRLVPPAAPPCPIDPDCVTTTTFDLTKVHYETWEVDLAPYKAAMSSLADVRFVEITIDTQVGQPVYVDTVSLVKRP